jgi:hypothetical protein
MKAFWITFEDGSKACCEGQHPGDAASIAEYISGKSVMRKPDHKEARVWQHECLEIEELPYPASPRIWAFDHPVNGKHPEFCWKPDQCAGKSCCPRKIACDN